MDVNLKNRINNTGRGNETGKENKVKGSREVFD